MGFGVTVMASLANVVEDLCVRAGLSSTDLDVSLLSGDVDGFVVSNRASIRSTLQKLQEAFFFDTVESGGKIKFVPRGGSSVATITEDDLVEIAEDVYVEIIRREDRELPRTLNVIYIAKNGEYQQSNQEALRQIADTGESVNIVIPIVMTGTKAKQIADATLFSFWIERLRFSFAVSRKYFYLEPGDIITLSMDDGLLYTVRITKTVMDNQKLSIEGLQADDAVYTQTNSAGDDTVTPVIETIPGDTILHLMDIPLIRETDDTAGFYAAVTKETPGWKGSQLYNSSNGTDYTFLSSMLFSNPHGTVATALADGQPYFIDRKTEIVVVMIDGVLSSVTEEDLYNGLNGALLGSEIVQFQNAELVAANTYKLTNILRGRLGTEDQTSLHTTNEDFILLNSTGSNFVRINTGLDLIGATKFYKAVSIGTTISDTTAETFVNNGRSLQPYSPVRLTGVRNTSGDLTITWVRRTRYSGGWNSSIEIPLNETTESYEIDIVDGSNVVLRTLYSTSETVTYTAAQQTTDFGSPQTIIKVRVHQMSSRIGRGTKAEATL